MAVPPSSNLSRKLGNVYRKYLPSCARSRFSEWGAVQFCNFKILCDPANLVLCHIPFHRGYDFGRNSRNDALLAQCARYFAKSVANFVPVYYMSVEAGEEEVEQGGQVVEKCYHFANVGRVQVFRV